MLVTDPNGLTHEVFDNHGTVCGKFHPTIGTAADDAVLTCFFCMHPDLETECGHSDAELRNCPYAADINNDNSQRCKCCDSCAHNCAMDI